MLRRMDYRGRQHRALEALPSSKLDALLITHAPNIQYVCGFNGSSGTLVAQARGFTFFTDGRYSAQARQQVSGARAVIAKSSPLAAAAAAVRHSGARHVGIEADHMPVALRASVAGLLPKGIRLRDTSGFVERFRMIKERDEVERIRAAVLLGAALLDTAVEAISPGVSESAVAAEIEYAARQAGAESMSFPTIVAAGPRSALPHGRASAQPIPDSGFVVMDFGVILGGYCSDMTRTVHVGKAGRERRALYEAVRTAQQVAIEAVRPGRRVGEVDRVARSSLRRAGLGRYF